MKNYVQLIGRCGSEPEIKTFASGKTKVHISLATSITTIDSAGNATETTTWHRVIAWESIAKRVKDQVHKGTAVLVEGRLGYGSYENKDGQTVNFTEIIAERVVPVQV